MESDLPHFLVPVGSTTWWVGIAFTVLLVFAALRLPLFAPTSIRRKVEWVWSILLLISIGMEHSIMLENDWWSVRWSLPFHMCSLSGLFTIIALTTRNSIAFHFAAFWGISGGIHSVLTPEMTLGGEGLLSLTYYFWHASIIAAPLYLFRWRKIPLMRRATWIIWILTQPALLFVAGLNYWVDGNYMFLFAPPEVDNPFVTGPFPYHLIGFELAGILHFGLTEMGLRLWKRRWGDEG